MLKARGLAATILFLAAWTCLPTPAAKTYTVHLRAAFTPERLGKGTTMAFGFTIKAPDGRVPSPLTDVALLYPDNLGVITSDLGRAICDPAQLEALGLCPVNSLMGYGAALVEIPIGPERAQERAGITVFLGPAQNGHLGLLFYVNGEFPVSGQFTLPGVVLTAPAPFGGRLETTLPLVPVLPEGPYASLVSLHTTIGPRHITYYTHIHGHWRGYHPNGLLLPNHCPPGGFPFAAEFNFQDGSHTTAHTTVPCPPTRPESMKQRLGR